MKIAPAVERRRRSRIPLLVILATLFAVGIKLATTSSSHEITDEDRARAYVNWAARAWTEESPRRGACPPVTEHLLEPAHRFDPWGREPRYLCEPRAPYRLFVISAGEDGAFSTDDDVASR